MASFTASRAQQALGQERKALAAARPSGLAPVARAAGVVASALVAPANVVGTMHGNAPRAGPGRPPPWLTPIFGRAPHTPGRPPGRARAPEPRPGRAQRHRRGGQGGR
jgi:hypothetical protein